MRKDYLQIIALSLIIIGSISFISKTLSPTAQLAQAISSLDTDPALVKRWATAQTFNGTTDFVLTDADYIGTGPITVTAWITPRSFGGGGFGRIVDNDHFEFGLRGSSTGVEARNNNDAVTTSAENSIALNTKQFVAVTRNGTNVIIYVNGIQSGYVNANDMPVASTINTYIGNRRTKDTGFDGAIEDLRIYNRVLTANEIATIYSGTTGGTGSAGDTGGTGTTTPSPTANPTPVNGVYTVSKDGTGHLPRYKPAQMWRRQARHVL